MSVVALASACFALGLVIATVLFGGGCAAAKPACAVVDLAQQACVLVRYTAADGTVRERRLALDKDGTVKGECP